MVQTAIGCVVNGRAHSNGASKVTQRIPQLFREHGAQTKLVVARKGDDIISIARGFVEAGSKLVVAAGGDGTVSAVAAALAGTETCLGILPLGTLNHFAKDLNIPLDLDAAVVNVITGEPAQVDVAEVNGRVFVNNSSLGLYPTIVQERRYLRGRGYGKWIAFAQAVVLQRCPWFHAGLYADGVFEAADRTPFIFIGNNRYETSGFRIGDRDTLNGGRLWVCRAPGAGRAELIWLAVRAAFGRSSPGELKILEAEELWVQSKPGRLLKVANDGEVLSLPSPLHYRILPGALRVIVPRRAHT